MARNTHTTHNTHTHTLKQNKTPKIAYSVWISSHLSHYINERNTRWYAGRYVCMYVCIVHSRSMDSMRRFKTRQGGRGRGPVRGALRQSVMLLDLPKLSPCWLAPLLVPIWRPMMVWPSRSLSSLKCLGLYSDSFTPSTGPWNPFFWACTCTTPSSGQWSYSLTDTARKHWSVAVLTYLHTTQSPSQWSYLLICIAHNVLVSGCTHLLTHHTKP